MIFCADPEILKDVARFGRQELELACEDFSNIIGSSPDSLVYKGTMKTGPEIAVISMSMKEEQWTGYLELYFQTEVLGNNLASILESMLVDKIRLRFHLEYPFRWRIWRESTTRIQENYWVIAERAVHLQGCWFLSMHQMAHYMSIYIVCHHCFFSFL